MFKRSVIASAIAAAAIMSSGAAVAETDKDAGEKHGHEIYGKVAVQLAHRDYAASHNHNSGAQINNETHLGWRGFARFDALPEHTKFIWQVESGYVDESFGGKDGGNGYLGRRDTFVGLESEKFGLIRAGRVLTPIYELIDWPATNPGMGDVWDWGGNIGGQNFNDRQSDTIRWDTNELWSGFTLDLAAGAGRDRAGGTESPYARNNYWHGAAAHQKFTYGDGNWVQLDFAYEMNYNSHTLKFGGDDDNNTLWDNQTYLAGIQGDHGPVGYYAQYRVANAQEKLNGVKEQEISHSTGLMYNFGENRKWQAKASFAKHHDLRVDGARKRTSDSVWSTQLMYKIDPTAVVYVRYRDVKVGSVHNSRHKTGAFSEISSGIEYAF